MSDHMLYGAQLDADRTSETLRHLFRNNLRAQEDGLAATPICIWGMHGIGKTMLVEEYAREMVRAEETHVGEMDKMLREPGATESVR